MTDVLFTRVRRGARARYLPTAVPTYDGLTDGAYTVVVKDGRCVSLRRVTDEDRLALVAAAEPARKAMETALLAAMTTMKVERPLTAAESKAWDRFCRDLLDAGEPVRPMTYLAVAPSDVVDAGIRALCAESRP